MREILFRGKTLDGGRWIDGDLRNWPSGSVGICDRATNRTIKVDPETVGQYTGLNDKNGKPIFEGDILQVDSLVGGYDRCIVGFGAFSPFGYEGTECVGFYLYWKSDKQAFQKYANICYWLRERKAISIGNIHDNPELVKEG